MISGNAVAQIICGDITASPVDSVSAIRIEGRPGDTVWVPISVRTDLPMSGFRILIKWDATKIAPILDFDPIDQINYLRTQLAGRFVQKENPSNPNDTTTNFFAQISQDPFDSSAMLFGYNISPDSPLVSVEPGTGIIFRVAMEIHSTTVHNDSGIVRFYQIQPVYLPPPPGQPIVLDCKRTELSVDFDGTGATVTRYPRVRNAYVVADSAPAPEIRVFESVDNTIQQGDATTLNYHVVNVDSVSITGGSLNLGFLVAGNDTVGSRAVSPQQTTTYTLRAFNPSGSSMATATVNVVSDTTVNEDAPAISFPDGSTFNIEQGQTVSFRVRATDPNQGNTVTLSATSLPNNASFAQVVGTNQVEGTFSFTPDVTQQGTFVATFKAIDNTNNSSIANATINVEALQFDRLFSTSATGQSPVGGLRGKRNIVFPINMVSQQTVYGVQFDMNYDPGAMKIDSFLVTSRAPDYVVYDDIGGTPGQIRVVTFGTANESVLVDSTTTAVLNMYLSLDSDAVVWTDYVIDMHDGRESVDPNPAIPSLEMLTDPGIVQVDNPGDVNLDKRIDVGDLVNIVAYIIGNFGLTTRQYEVSDIIRNDTVNVFDLVADINKIFGIPVSPVAPPPIESEPATMVLSYNDLLPGQQDVLVVKSDLPEKVAAAELNIAYDNNALALGVPQLGIDASGMAIQYKHDGKGNVKVLMYFKNPFNTDELLPAGQNVEMLKFPLLAARNVESGNKNQIKLSQALLSTANSATIAVKGLDDEPLLPETFDLMQNFPNPFNPTTTIEFTIGQSEDGALTQRATLDIFNILGQRVTNLVDNDLPSGKYRVVWDSRNDAGQRVSTGVYFYRMVVGKTSQSKKMLLLK